MPQLSIAAAFLLVMSTIFYCQHSVGKTMPWVVACLWGGMTILQCYCIGTLFENHTIQCLSIMSVYCVTLVGKLLIPTNRDCALPDVATEKLKVLSS